MTRVRVLGDLYHGRIPEGAIYVGRAAPGLKASPFRNPFKVSEHGSDALRLYAEFLDRHPELVQQARRELAGHDLACWCRVGAGAVCHADHLIRLVLVFDALDRHPHNGFLESAAAWWAKHLVEITPALEGHDPASLVDLIRQWVRHRDSLRLPGEPWGIFQRRVFGGPL